VSPGETFPSYTEGWSDYRRRRFSSRLLLASCPGVALVALGRLTGEHSHVDVEERYALTLENAVLNVTANKHVEGADATFTLTKQAWTNVAFGLTSLKDSIASDEITTQGEAQPLVELFDLLDRFEPQFNIVTP
jgi:alkyl sulfatase BDS1-like metallo-beta-lactamase superfamily hydrolase